jgi:hypothetical protein
MPSLTFPASPVVGQLYQFGSNTWQCVAAGPPPVWNLVYSYLGNSQPFVPLTVTDIYLTFNATTNSNLNLYTICGSPTVPVTVHMNVAASISLIGPAGGGTGAAASALQVGTGWATGSKLIITGPSSAVISGAFGPGGATQASALSAGHGGTVGGDGLYLNTSSGLTSIDVSGFLGTIAGGGGGGGGGASGTTATTNEGGAGGAGSDSTAAGSTGIAGNSAFTGGAGGAGGTLGNNNAVAGTNGTAPNGAGGGGGGSWGEPGANGGSTVGGAHIGGLGAAAGYAIRENGNTLIGTPATSYGTIG